MDCFRNSPIAVTEAVTRTPVRAKACATTVALGCVPVNLKKPAFQTRRTMATASAPMNPRRTQVAVFIDDPPFSDETLGV
jgi:hypothetical protein